MGSETDEATGWEYNLVHTDRLGSASGPQLALIWKRPYSDGSTDWDQIKKLGREGWEMVNAFPVESSGTLQYLAFMFKRRIVVGAGEAGAATATAARTEADLSPASQDEAASEADAARG